MEDKQYRGVVHLQVDDNDHRYFSNVKALFDSVPQETIGASYNYVRNKLSKETSMITKTGCVIRKGVLITSTNEKKDNLD